MKIIIIGAGKVGFSLAQTLTEKGYDVTVIEKDRDRVMRISDYLDVQAICANGAQLSVLEDAGVGEADILIAVTARDEINMMACFLGKSAGVKMTVARVRQPVYAELTASERQRQLGIDLIINPEQFAAEEIANLILYPEAHDVQYYADNRVLMLGLKLTSDLPVIGKNLIEIQFPRPCVAVTIIREDEIIIPRGDTRLLAGDEIYVAAATIDMPEIEKYLGIKHTTINNIAIFGGHLLGYYLALVFENKIRNYNVKLFEEEEARCKVLSERLHNTMIIKAAGTDANIMEDENISEMDIVTTVYDDDRENVMVSMIAKSAGAKKIITQMRRSDYVQMIEKFGIDKAVSPRSLMTTAILCFINRGRILNLKMLQADKAQMNEIVIPEKSRLSGKALKDIRLPLSSIVAVIVRGDQLIIPKGDDILLPLDRVLVFALTEEIKYVIDYLTKDKEKDEN